MGGRVKCDCSIVLQSGSIEIPGCVRRLRNHGQEHGSNGQIGKSFGPWVSTAGSVCEVRKMVTPSEAVPMTVRPEGPAENSRG
jgi:hypothetical protein